MTPHAHFRRRLGVASLGTLLAVSALAVAGPAVASGSHATSGRPALGAAPHAAERVASSRLAADTSGTTTDGRTVYVADESSGGIIEVAPDGTSSRVGDFQGPTGVAVDDQGNLYVADYHGNAVYKLTPDGTQTALGTDGEFSSPFGVAVDAAGDVFVTDADHSRVVEIAPDGTETTLPFTGLSRPYPVAVDAAGDVYVGDYGIGGVQELTPDGTQTSFGAGWAGPTGITVDHAGNVWVADYGTGRVVETAPDETQTTVYEDSARLGVTTGASGNVYSVGFDAPGVTQIAPDGTLSTVVPDVNGLGVAVLEQRPVTFTSDAPTDAVPGDTYTVSATADGSEAPVDLAAAKSSARTCVVSDNGDGSAEVDLNRVGDCVIVGTQPAGDALLPAYGTQNVTVKHRQAITFSSSPQHPAVDGSYQVTAAGGDSENAVVFSLGEKSEDGCTVTSDGLVTFDHATSCTIAADQAGDDGYAPAATAYQQISIDRGNQEVTFTTMPPAKAKVGKTYRPAATGGASGHRIRFSTTGACTVRNGVVTFTHAGHCYLFANQTGNDDYASGKAHQTFAVVKR